MSRTIHQPLNAKTIAVALAASSLLSVGSAYAVAPLYRITDLGDLPGGDSFSLATVLNDKGEVSGYSDTAPNVNTGYGDEGYHGFIWDAQNGMRDIGAFGDQRAGFVTGINEQGTVVGYRWGGWSRGFQWTSSSGLVDLGVSGGYPYSEARGINDAGYIVENNWNFYGPPSSSYLRSPNGSRLNIGATTGVPNPMGNAINNSNQIAGSNYGPGSAFRWDAANGMIAIRPLSGGASASAIGINNTGIVVGSSTVADGSSHPFIWDYNTGIRDLGLLNSGGNWGGAYGINDTNFVVGSSAISSNIYHAFVWDENSGLTDLNSRLINGAMWQYLIGANAINNVGQIVGYGILANGDTHAFILDPVASPVPIPAAAWLFASAISSLLVLGCRNAKR